MSLYEPVFNEGQDTLYVIDQDKRMSRTARTTGSHHLALVDAYKKLGRQGTAEL